MFISPREPKRPFLSVFGIAWLVCSMSVNCLIASPQHPYVHELFGPELLLAWPEGQKAHENAMELFYAGDYVLAVQKLDEAIADAERFSKAKEKDVAILLSTKAQWLAFMGDSQASDTAFLRAQSLAEPVLGTNHPVTARIQILRAEVFLLRDNVPEAKVALGRAIAAQAARHDPNAVVAAINLRQQAMVCLPEGDTARARTLISQSSQIIKRAAGIQSSLYGVNLWLESLVATATGEYENAIRLCESSLTVLTNCYGPEHFILARVRGSLANSYQRAGIYEKALPILQDNLRTLEKTLGSDSVDAAITLNALGQLHYQLGNNSDAELLLRRCLSIREKKLGVDNPDYAVTVNNLAFVLITAGKDDDAETLFKDASLVLAKSLGKNSPHLATILLHWGMFKTRLGDLDDAKRLIERAIEIQDKAFGKNHPAMAEAAEAYAELQRNLGDYKYAQQLASLALSIKTNSFARDHPAMARHWSLAARVFAGIGDEYKAAELHGRSALIMARAFGGEHPNVASELEATGLALCRAGEYDKAGQPILMALRSQRDYLVEQVARAKGEDGLKLAHKTFYRTELFHSLCALSFSNATTSVPVKAAEQLASCKALLEEVQATQASLETDSRTATRQLRETLESIQNQLARLPENNLDPTQRDARRRQLETAKTPIEEALAKRNGLVAQTIRERKLALTDIARSLPSQSALLDFIQYQRYDFAAKTKRWKEQRYAAYLTFPLARDSTNVVVERVDLGEAAPINEAVELVCQRMSAGQFAAKDLSPALQRLSQWVYARSPRI